MMSLLYLMFQSPFTCVARNMKDLSGDRGVLKKQLRPGTGPVVPEGATVTGLRDFRF